MRYHSRHPKKEITDPAALHDVVARAKHLTLALCRKAEPYLVTVNYAFDQNRDCFYFHCATEGRKLDMLEANPQVYGQILEDLGYLVGKCDHSYRTVQFEGSAALVADPEEKLRALEMLVDALEPDPASVKARLLRDADINRVAIVRIDVSSWSGKHNP
jgi:nitroimidazol reductase NimA-like FMN-containing flavoprotein (pyridoxamine 5'-phosphate oxidase superfamily)